MNKFDPYKSDILFVITQNNSTANGGVKSVSNVVCNTPLDVHIVTNKHTPYVNMWQSCGSKVFVRKYDRYTDLTGLSKLFNLVYFNIRSYFHVSTLNPSVVHTNDRPAFRSSALGILAANVPIVNNIRDTHPRMQGLRRVKTLLEFALSDVVLTLSQEMCACWTETLRFEVFPESLRRSFLEKMTFIYSIVDPNRFHPPETGQQDIRTDLEVAGAPLLAYVASFHPKKRQLAFIEKVLPDLVDQHPEATVAFVGDFVPSKNDQAHACRRVVEALGLNDNVRFTGYRDDVERWYQAADLTVLASENEGLARSMIESVACGTPVVSFDVASAREILEGHNCGLVVPQGNYRELRTGIIELWEDDSLRTSMGRQGATIARTLFNPETVARQYQTLYQRIATR